MVRHPLALTLSLILMTGCSTKNHTDTINSEPSIKSGLTTQEHIATIPPEIALDPKLVIETRNVIKANSFTNGNFGIIDWRSHSAKPRFYFFDSESGFAGTTLVSHGIRSGRAYANEFSDGLDSNMSPTGFLLGAEAYIGKNGYSMRIDGMEKKNRNTRARNIRLHPSNYATDEHVSVNKMLGRSDGCLAVQPELSKQIIELLKDGGVIYLYHDGRLR